MKKNLWKPFIALTLAFCLFCGATGACASAIGSGAIYTGETYDAYPPIGAGASYTGTRTYNAAFGLVDGTNTLNLRTGPGTQYDWLRSIPQGTWLGIMGESGNWYYVYLAEDSSVVGYVSKNFVKTQSGGGSGSATGVVNNPKPTSFLNLRQYPSYSAPVLGIYYNGATFTVLSFSDGWYQVQINGVVGYFRQEFVRINGASGGTEGAYVKTPNGGKINLRDCPSYSGSSIIGQYLNGSQVTVLLRGKGASASSFWKVSINGVTGYADSTFLSLSPYAPSPTPAHPTTNGYAVVNNPKATQYLNLRAQPSTAAKVIAQYRNGVRFEVIAQGVTWTKVYGSATGNIGYFMTKYLSLRGLPATPTKTIQNGNTYVNLRSAPSKQTGVVYQRLYSGTSVIVLTPGDEWTQVRCGNTTGYVMTCFLK